MGIRQCARKCFCGGFRCPGRRSGQAASISALVRQRDGCWDCMHGAEDQPARLNVRLSRRMFVHGVKTNYIVSRRICVHVTTCQDDHAVSRRIRGGDDDTTRARANKRTRRTTKKRRRTSKQTIARTTNRNALRFDALLETMNLFGHMAYVYILARVRFCQGSVWPAISLFPKPRLASYIRLNEKLFVCLENANVVLTRAWMVKIGCLYFACP